MRMALADKQHSTQWSSHNRTRKLKVFPVSRSAEKVWMIVRRGQRRMLTEVDLDVRVLSVEQAESRIPCCSINSRQQQQYRQKQKISSCRQREFRSTACDALRSRPSRIPCKPQTVQHNAENGIIPFTDGEKDNDNNDACAVQQENDRFKGMDRRIRRLRNRMDQWSLDLKQWNNQMNSRLDELHQQLDRAAPSRTFNTVVRMIVLSMGRSLIMHAVLAFFAAALPIQTSREISTCSSERNALRYKLRFFRRLLGESRESNSVTLLSNMLKAFTRGMTWARNHRFSKNEQPAGEGTEDGQTRPKSRYSLRPFGVKPLGSGVKKKQCKNAVGPTVQVVGTSSGGQHKEIFPPLLNIPFKGSHTSAPSDKLPQPASGNIALRSAAINHPPTRLGLSEPITLRQRKPCFSMSRYQSLLHSQKMPRAATMSIGRSSSSEETVVSESLLEAIKPDEWNSPPSHLEAESDKILLHPDMFWSSSSSSSYRENRIRTLWKENEHSFSESGIRPWSSPTMSSEEGESEGSEMSFFVGSESSIENPFYDCLDLLDTWDEECVYREAKWLYLSPNLVYGVEDMEEREDVSQTAVRGEMDEIKTKWISVNDFI